MSTRFLAVLLLTLAALSRLLASDPFVEPTIPALTDAIGMPALVEEAPHGARITCPVQDIEGWLSPTGLEIRSVGDGEYGSSQVRALALVRSGHSFGLSAGQVLVSDGMARLVRPGIVEEITASSDGIRQDWVLSERPVGNGALSLVIGFEDAALTNVQDHRLDLTIAGGRRMTWHALEVRDARGTVLPARFTYSAVDMSKIAIVIDDRNAEYPVRIDPTFTDSDWFTVGQYPGAYGTSVNAMTVFGGQLIVAGDFLMAGGVSGSNNIARWNGTLWSALGTGTNGPINALTVIGTNLYVGGSFTSAGGVAATNVAKWNGATWSAMGVAGAEPVTALAAIGTTLYAAGRFLDETGTSELFRVGQWNGSTWVAVGTGLGTYVSDPTFYSVNSLAVVGGILYAGGDATSGSALVKWNGTMWSMVGVGLNGGVNTCVANGSDLYVGGTNLSCPSIPGTTPFNIFKWDGSVWSTFGTGLDEPVLAIGIHSGTLYAGGEEDWNSTVRGRLKQWTGSTWSDTGSKSLSGKVRCIASFGGRLHVGGGFVGAGDGFASDYDGLSGVTQLISGAWEVIGNGILGKVQAMANIGADLYVGGDFSAAGGTRIHHIARWNGSIWSAVSGGLSGYSVNALHVMGGKLYAGGGFGTAGGVTITNGVACWDGTAWSAPGTGPYLGEVLSLTSSGSDLYAAGGLGSASGFVSRLTGGVWSSLGSVSDGPVFNIAVYNGNLHAGGNFTQIGGARAEKIAKWNGSAWSALPRAGTGPSGRVTSLAVLDGYLYVGGYFSWNVSSRCLARWNGTAWSAVGGGVSGFSGPISEVGVNNMLVRGADLYVIGSFNQAGTIAASGLACWSGNSWKALGSGVGSGQYGGNCLGSISTDLFVGEDLGVRRAHLTAPPGTPSDSNAATNQVAENTVVGATTGLTVFSIDPEGATVTYSLTNNAGDRFVIHATTGVVTVAGALNYENASSHLITVRATDGINSAVQNFTIVVTDVNEPLGALVDSNASTNQVAEDAFIGAVVGITGSANDPEGAAITYQLSDNAGGLFAIHSATGMVTVIGALDYEKATSHMITISASDGTYTVTQIFTIAVTGVNEPPSIPTDANGAYNQVNEDAPLGQTVGVTASVMDPEGDPIVFDLTDSAGGRFAIDSGTGIVTTAGTFSFATSANHTITVRATAGGQNSSASFVVAVLVPSGGSGLSSSSGGGGSCGLGGGLATVLSVLLLCLRRRDT